VKDIGSNYQSARVVSFTYCVWEVHCLCGVDEHEWARVRSYMLRNRGGSTKIRGGFIGTHLHFCEWFEKLERSAGRMCGLPDVLVYTQCLLLRIFYLLTYLRTELSPS
jgi:hypothetical protein